MTAFSLLGLALLSCHRGVRLADLALILSATGVCAAGIHLLRSVSATLREYPAGPAQRDPGKPARREGDPAAAERMLPPPREQRRPMRVIICSSNPVRKSYLVSLQGGEPFEVPMGGSKWRPMTLSDWESLYPGITPPEGELSRIGKLIFGNGRYYTFIGDEGSYVDQLNRTSCSFGQKPKAAVGPSGSLKIAGLTVQKGEVAGYYQDLLDFVGKQRLRYSVVKMPDGTKTVVIPGQQWEDAPGLNYPGGPLEAVSSVNYNFDADDNLHDMELFIWTSTLLHWIDERVGLLPGQRPVYLGKDEISVRCGDSACSIAGLPDDDTGEYLSLIVNEIARLYLDIERIY